MEKLNQKQSKEELQKIEKQKEIIANLYMELSANLGQNEKIKEIEYYEKMKLLPEEISKYGFELDVLIVQKQIINEKKQEQTVYELYDDENNQIGIVEDGKVHFNPEYLELTKQRCKDDDYLYNKLLELDGKIEYQDLIEQNKDNSIKLTEKQIKEYAKKKDEKENEETIENNQDKSIKEIAETKGIPEHSIIFVKEDSTLYRNHPELESNMFFYRDKDGIVKAEYIDENGVVQPSQFIENSKSYMRTVISIGKDGNPIEKEVPYQFMTSNIKSKGANVREIGFSVNINMGYLEIEEARLGSNGEWSSHKVEMRGRDYNSKEINETTDLEHKSSNPDKITESYEQVENTGFEDDGIQLDELNPENVIERLMDEGYQRDEAIDIINYMIGEEKLPEEKAKERVNDEIKQKRQEERKEKAKEEDYR